MENFFKSSWMHLFPRKAQGDDPEGNTGSAPDAVSGVAQVPAPAAAPVPTPAAAPVTTGRTLLIHGYSANGEDLIPWKNMLEHVGINAIPIAVGNYVTLNNEVTIKDLGEAFDRALRFTPWSTEGKDDAWTFDAIVHSTGMLVLRQWLTSDPFDRDDPRSRIRRLKHLVGLAPATFGSPQGKQGRSWLGALVKGNKDLGPDFLNAGDEVLDGLELGSRYTWDLAHKDMLCPKPLYDNGPNTPYVTVFIGNVAYSGIDALANSPGSDGTVRWAGCALNTRKVSVDLRRETKLKDANGNPSRCIILPWANERLAAPMIAVEGQNHGSIVANPDVQVANLIKDFFAVSDVAAYQAWETRALTFGAGAMEKMNTASTSGHFGGAGWQQLVVHVLDDHGDGVTDYNLQIFIGDSLDDEEAVSVPLIADTYSGDASYRCFYIRLSDEMLNLNTPQGAAKKMWLELIASSGSSLIAYEAYTDDSGVAHSLTIDHDGGSPAQLDITGLAQGAESLLYPYTTTLLEVFVEREPMPLRQVSQLFNFLP
jgi:hypothetical protein